MQNITGQNFDNKPKGTSNNIFYFIMCRISLARISQAFKQQFHWKTDSRWLNNPHLLDWVFSERTDRFVKFWLKESLHSSWHWYRYEYAVQRRSIHCHGVAKLKNDPGLCTLTEKALKGYLASKFKSENQHELTKEQIVNIDNEIQEGKEAETILCRYVDFLMSTWNPSFLMMDGQNQKFTHVKNHIFH